MNSFRRIAPPTEPPNQPGGAINTLAGLQVRAVPSADIIPEPATLSLLGLGALLALRRRRGR